GASMRKKSGRPNESCRRISATDAWEGRKIAGSAEQVQEPCSAGVVWQSTRPQTLQVARNPRGHCSESSWSCSDFAVSIRCGPIHNGCGEEMKRSLSSCAHRREIGRAHV